MKNRMVKGSENDMYCFAGEEDGTPTIRSCYKMDGFDFNMTQFYFLFIIRYRYSAQISWRKCGAGGFTFATRGVGAAAVANHHLFGQNSRRSMCSDKVAETTFETLGIRCQSEHGCME